MPINLLCFHCQCHIKAQVDMVTFAHPTRVNGRGCCQLATLRARDQDLTQTKLIAGEL